MIDDMSEDEDGDGGEGSNSDPRFFDKDEVYTAVYTAVYGAPPVAGHEQKLVCLWCFKAFGAATKTSLDHLCAWAHKGPTSLSNAAIMCKECNTAKGDLSIYHSPAIKALHRLANGISIQAMEEWQYIQNMVAGKRVFSDSDDWSEEEEDAAKEAAAAAAKHAAAAAQEEQHVPEEQGQLGAEGLVQHVPEEHGQHGPSAQLGAGGHEHHVSEEHGQLGSAAQLGAGGHEQHVSEEHGQLGPSAQLGAGGH